MSNLTVTSEKLRSLADRHSHTFAVSPDLIVACADRIEELEASLRDAIEDIEHWTGYADDYFAERWDLAGDLAKHRRTLEGEP